MKKTYVLNHPVSCIFTYLHADWYDSTRTNRHLRSEQIFWKANENSTPRRVITRARPRPPRAESGEAGKVRQDEQTAHQMVDLILELLVNGSEPSVK